MQKIRQIELSQQHALVISTMIDKWRALEILDQETTDLLNNSYSVASFNWRRLSSMAILASISCFFVAVGSIVFDEFIIRTIKQLFGDFETTLSVVFTTGSILFYFFGFYFRSRKPLNKFTNQGFLALGVICTAAALVSLGSSERFETTDASNFLMISLLIYGFLGLIGKSELVWLFAMISLAVYFGVETHKYADQMGMWFGMQYPTRFALFGLMLVMISPLLSLGAQEDDLGGVTLPIGLLILFGALWLMSMFGNSGELVNFLGTKAIGHPQWTGLLAITSGVSIWLGLKFDSEEAHGFGIVFFLINIFTRYFEFFWDATDKALFFSVLGFGLWILGMKAQKIWSIGLTKASSKPDDLVNVSE
jgi:hypothetical protein